MEKDQDLENHAKQLQNQSREQLRKNYAEKTNDPWQNPKNYEKTDTPDGFAQVSGPSGDTIKMYVKMEDGIVERCPLQTDGCGTVFACGSTAAQRAAETLSRSLTDYLHKNKSPWKKPPKINESR